MKAISLPVPRQAAALAEEWAEPLAARAGVAKQEFLVTPERYMNYPLSSVRVELMDGSHLEFRYAFALVNEAMRAIAVFSEHCGSFVLPYHDARVFQGGELQYSQNAA
jgi:hypothetical protein